MIESQPFEQHQRLSELLLHAANNWKTDSTWSETLEQINKVFHQNASLQSRVERYEKALIEIKNNCDGNDPDVEVFWHIAHKALNSL